MTKQLKKLSLTVAVAALLAGCLSTGDKLINAAYDSNSSEISKQIAAGANLNEQTNNGTTALHNAILSADISSTKLLLEAGANANLADFADVTPLHMSAVNQSLEIATLLLDAGADVNSMEPKGQHSPLHVAILRGNPEFVDLLIERGANVETLSKERSPLTLAVGYAPSYADQITQSLLNAGANPSTNDGGAGVLRVLLAENRTELLPVLVEAGLDPTIEDPESGLPVALVSVFPDVSEPLPTDTAEKLILVSETFGIDPSVPGADGLTAHERYVKGREVYLAEVRVAELREEQESRARAKEAEAERQRKKKSGSFWGKAIALGAGAAAIGYGVDQGLPMDMAAEIGSSLATDIILDTSGTNLMATNESLKNRAAAAEQLAERDAKFQAELAQARREDAAFVASLDAKNAEARGLIQDSLKQTQANLSGTASSNRNSVANNKSPSVSNAQTSAQTGYKPGSQSSQTSGRSNSASSGFATGSNTRGGRSKIDAPPPAKVIEYVKGSNPRLTWPEYHERQERYGCKRPPAGCAWVTKSQYWAESGKMQWTIKNECPGILAIKHDVPGTGGQGTRRTRAGEFSFYSWPKQELNWKPEYLAIYNVDKTSTSTQCYNEAFRTPVLTSASIVKERF